MYIETCKNCKWYDAEANGLCTFYVKFKDEDDNACERYDGGTENE